LLQPFSNLQSQVRVHNNNKVLNHLRSVHVTRLPIIWDTNYLNALRNSNNNKHRIIIHNKILRVRQTSV